MNNSTTNENLINDRSHLLLLSSNTTINQYLKFDSKNLPTILLNENRLIDLKKPNNTQNNNNTIGGGGGGGGSGGGGSSSFDDLWDDENFRSKVLIFLSSLVISLLLISFICGIYLCCRKYICYTSTATILAQGSNDNNNNNNNNNTNLIDIPFSSEINTIVINTKKRQTKSPRQSPGRQHQPKPKKQYSPQSSVIQDQIASTIDNNKQPSLSRPSTYNRRQQQQLQLPQPQLQSQSQQPQIQSSQYGNLIIGNKPQRKTSAFNLRDNTSSNLQLASSPVNSISTAINNINNANKNVVTMENAAIIPDLFIPNQATKIKKEILYFRAPSFTE